MKKGLILLADDDLIILPYLAKPLIKVPVILRTNPVPAKRKSKESIPNFSLVPVIKEIRFRKKRINKIAMNPKNPAFNGLAI